MAARRWEDWVIAVAVLAIAAVGVITIFDDEIARLRGKGTPHTQPVDGTAVPSVPGNTQGTL